MPLCQLAACLELMVVCPCIRCVHPTVVCVHVRERERERLEKNPEKKGVTENMRGRVARTDWVT